MGEDTDKAFQAALSQFWADAKWGNKTEISTTAGLTQGYINNLAQGRRAGTEKSRRAIASALGYDNYESFLNVGRAALGLKPIDTTGPRSPEIKNYLLKAEAVLDAGGEDAQNLKIFIDNLHRLHDLLHNQVSGSTSTPGNIWAATPEDWEAAKNNK